MSNVEAKTPGEIAETGQHDAIGPPQDVSR